MKVPSNPAVFSATKLAACALAAMILVPGVLAQVRPTHREDIPNYDKRARAVLPAAQAARQEQGRNKLQAQLPAAVVSFDALLDTPKFIRAHGSFLTGPDGEGLGVSAQTTRALPAGDPFRSVRGFLDEHPALFGYGAEVLADAEVTSDSVGAHNGLRTVIWQQRFDGLPVFEAVLIGNITKRGELASLSSHFLPDLAGSADAGTPNRAALQAGPPVSAGQAVINAAQDLGDTLAAGEVASSGVTEGAGYQRLQVRQGKAHARLVWLPLNRSALRLCWEVFVSKQATRENFQLLIDAESGEALVRRGLTKHISDATYNVYTSDSPSPFSPGWPTPNNGQPPLTNRVLVTLPALDTTASPDGWINDGDNETRGNNTDTFLDRDFDGQPDGARPQGNPTRVFDFPLDLTQAPDTYTDAATVQMFYWVNWYHDRAYQLGFTESAGNFQNNNFGRGGLGNDAIVSYVQAGADIGFNNNAFFSWAPDGLSGEIAMFTWSFPNPDRDGDLDAEIIIHEATHGTSLRLVGGPSIPMTALQSGGLGEGWSDFYALAMLSEPGDDPDAVYVTGGYATFQFAGLAQNYYFGIRHFPYSTDMSKNPFTFKDIDPTQISPHAGVPRSPIYPFNAQEADEVHHQGEIWCVTLWDCRANLVRRYGYAGNELMLQLVTDGMKLSPANPNFLQARDAIILADFVNNGGANAGDLWAGFAKRGMGFSATSPDSSTTIGLSEAFDTPGINVVGVNVLGGNGNGVIDINECNDLEIILANFNNFAVTGLRVSLSTRTPGVALGVRDSNYPDLLPVTLGTNLVPFTISTAPFFICGTPITLQALIKSDQETRTNTIVLNTGSIGAPVRFDSVAPVAIPDNNALGTNSPIVVSNITAALRQVSVSLYLTHTFDFDLRLELIGPDGTVVILSDSNGGSGDNYGAGCTPESFRTTFDDDAGIPIGTAFPPFVGTFRPDEALSAFGGKFGTNVNGTWQLHVVDQFQQDLGVLQCWSLFLSPAACEDGGGTCPGADLALGITDTPDPVFIGSNLVYTVSVTNNGPSAATNVVINQFLPGSVVFVSALASQGTATHAGGTVIGNLGAIPFTGVATMTVTVTPTAAGTIVSSASVSSINSDPDPGNNSASTTTQVHPATSDLAVGILDAPDPALIGGALTYTVSVTNNGPSSASGVTLTNTLPVSVIVNSATPSQGNATINGNIVVCNFGTLTNGGRASVTINVTPTAQGTIVATAVARANQVDPIAGNNTASASTTVGPAADLSISMIDTPDPVVVRSNWSYVITVMNHGPSTASGVVVNHTLPANVSVVSSNATQGTITLAGNSITASLGTLANGGSATVMVTVNATNSGLYSSTATVSGSQADQNTANNSASASTTVAPRNLSIVPAGATLTAESVSPPNGALDVGETVTVQLRLRNAGNVPNTNLVATLLATGGVTSPSGPQNYGILTPSDFPTDRTFAFTASGTNGGTVVATLQLQDDGNNLGTVSFSFPLPIVRTFANTNRIAITDDQPIPWPAGPATPYPSTLTVSNVTGLVGKVAVTLSKLSHSFPDDVDMLLVGPGGQKVILMSDAGGSDAVVSAIVTFDDTASAPLPDSGQILSASYRPSDYEPGDPFPANAPAGPYGTSLSAFAGVNPNGVWSLYIVDDTTGDPGSVANGWSLAFTTISPVNQLADLGLSAVLSPSPRLVAANLAYIFTVTNAGPNAATGVAFTNPVPPGATLVSVIPSQGSASTNGNTAVCNLGTLNPGATATVTVVLQPGLAGSLTNTATVAAIETDLNPADNTASVVTLVNVPVADVGMGKVVATNSIVIGSNVTFTLTVTNHGPEPALNVVVTDPLTNGLSFVGTSASSFVNSAGTISLNLGDLAPGAVAAVTLTATATSTGPRTNIAFVTTTSSDANTTNNAAPAEFTVTTPSPRIVAAGAILSFESGPINATVDTNETVTVLLSLQNVGTANTTDLVATLLAANGVTSPSSPTNYGALVHGGAAVSRSFTFTATGTNGGAVVATLQLQDGAYTDTVAFTFHFPATHSFTNPAAIAIPDHGGATPYPSTIEVAGVTGQVSKVTVTLNGVTHGFPDDVDMLLVGPTGRKLVLMSDAGGGHTITNLTLNFNDAGGALPDATAIAAGTYAPTDYEPGEPFPPPAPAGALGTNFGVFNGTNPQGTWSLYVVDDSNGDAGSIQGGWILNLTVVDTVNPTADLVIGMTDAPDPVYVASGLTYSITVNNNGPVEATGVTVTDALPAGLQLVSAASSQGSVNTSGNLVTGNLGALAAGSGATVTIRVAPSLGGTIINTATLTANELDLNLANNSAQTTTVVAIPAVVNLTEAGVTNGLLQLTLTGEPNMVYVIQASTNLTSWVPVSTNVAAPNGTFKFTDDNAPNFSRRFYRAVRLIP